MLVIGFALIIQGVAGGAGGGVVVRVVLGFLFVAAGAGRLYVLFRRDPGRGGEPR
jgi:hypothetical protein